MSIFVSNSEGECKSWVDVLAEQLPDQYIYEYKDLPNKEDVEYAVVWNHPHGDLGTFPNLKAILVLGAGTDFIDRDHNLPRVPLVRLIDPDVGNDMAHYVLYWVMHFHRHYEKYRQQTPNKSWARYEMPRSKDYRVTVLGLGRIGAYIAQQLAANNFYTSAWNRSVKNINQVNCYTGEAGMSDALTDTDVLVNCLPLNQDTQTMLNAELLSQLPRGANLINVSRGAVIDDAALIELMQSGHIAAAALDTFSQEPLPSRSPYWSMPKVFVTPHMSGSTYAKSAARVISDNIKRIEKGEEPFPIHKPPEQCYD
jgi:glyoxylate/hydroxypyruvate reductase A